MYVGIDTDFLVRLSMTDHPGHLSAIKVRDYHVESGDQFVLAPQVVNEFVHVATDPRRFNKPLTVKSALDFARQWCLADEVDVLAPSLDSLLSFFDEMKQHRLGRKRVLDTSLATTLLSSGVNHLITSNPRDYRIFPDLELIEMK